MFLIEDVPCEAASRRGRLHHSWLKNEVLQWDAEYLLEIRNSNSLELADFEERIKPGGGFEQELAEATILIQTMVHDFSCTPLVELCPLAELPAEAKQLVKDVLHQAYLRESHVDELQEPLKEAVEALACEFRHCREVWFQKPSAEADTIRGTLETLKKKASDVQTILTKLPRGIVVP